MQLCYGFRLRGNGNGGCSSTRSQDEPYKLAVLEAARLSPDPNSRLDIRGGFFVRCSKFQSVGMNARGNGASPLSPAPRVYYLELFIRLIQQGDSPCSRNAWQNS